MKDIIAKKNHASGNAGGVLVVDVVIPVLLIGLYVPASKEPWTAHTAPL